MAIRVPGGHVGGVGAVVRVVEVMCATVKAAPSGAVALVLEACHCGCDVGGIGGVDVAGEGRMQVQNCWLSVDSLCCRWYSALVRWIRVRSEWVLLLVGGWSWSMRSR